MCVCVCYENEKRGARGNLQEILVWEKWFRLCTTKNNKHGRTIDSKFIGRADSGPNVLREGATWKADAIPRREADHVRDR